MMKKRDQRQAAIRVALPFTFRHWRKYPGLLIAVMSALLGATVADLFMPVFAGRMVDAVALGVSDPAAQKAAFFAFGCIIALGVVQITLRHVGFQAIVPFTLSIMSDVSREAFARVQR